MDPANTEADNTLFFFTIFIVLYFGIHRIEESVGQGLNPTYDPILSGSARLIWEQTVLN